MLEYCKKILEKVSFDQRLFEKELIKSLKNLNENHKKELMNWCNSKYGHIYPQILENCHEKYFQSSRQYAR